MSEPGGKLTHLALCWRLERRDGAGLGLTSHDRPLLVNGERYEPSPGILPAATRSEIGTHPASCEVSGSLSSSAISESDVVAGRWDGASVRPKPTAMASN
jgi:uncharacterized phage protein (TIGR02218 family)